MSDKKGSNRLEQTLLQASAKVSQDRVRADSIRSNWVSTDIRVSAPAPLLKVG
jgi:hypothetical protein